MGDYEMSGVMGTTEMEGARGGECDREVMVLGIGEVILVKGLNVEIV